jgi:uncharacterized protein with NRDE domain
MCLIFFSLREHPEYPVIVAANRDEFYQRPTQPVDFWAEAPNILAGRDLQAEGTWLGVSRTGRFAFVTNFRDPANIRSAAPSRGKLVSNFLQSKQSPEDYIGEVAERGADYNGFNLVVGTATEAWYVSNYQSGSRALAPGYYGLSNALLETPWPKLVQGKEKLRPLMNQSTLDSESVFRVLYDQQRASDNELPDTGIGLERERALSSMFIKTTGYGTRCSTLLLIDRHQQVQITERTYNTSDFTHFDTAFSFQFQSAS